MEPVIDLRNVNLTLSSRAGSVDILHDVGLAIGAGESVGIVGPSGSGKTTLLMAMAGLEQVSSGTVAIAGTAFHALDEDALARVRGQKIGIVFQSFHLVPTMTALENVALPLEFSGDADARIRARELLERVGLADRLDHLPSQLSGGEQQRVALARALAPKPALVLADEPTGNLDEATSEKIMDLLFEMKAQDDLTLVLVTHDRTLADRCTRVISMKDGRIADDTGVRPKLVTGGKAAS